MIAHDIAKTPAQNLPALLALEYDDFVECAYLTILNRAADSEALTHYVQRLKAGHSKLAILSALYSSEEARKANVRIPWMRRAILKYKLTRIPIVRLAFKLSEKRDFRLDYEHRLHVLESQMTRLSSQYTLQTAQLAELTGAIQGFVQPAENNVQPLPDIYEWKRELPGNPIVAGRVYQTLRDHILNDISDETPLR